MSKKKPEPDKTDTLQIDETLLFSRIAKIIEKTSICNFI
jgi:hypothetical protein